MGAGEISPIKPEGDNLFDRVVFIEIRHIKSGVLDAMAMAVEQFGIKRGFSPNLAWFHYRALWNRHKLWVFTRSY